MSRRKGFDYEREVVKAFGEAGIDPRRMWGSDGRSSGLHQEVDIEAGGKYYQCKRKKKIADTYRPSQHVHAHIFREDRGDSFVLLRLDDYLEMIR